MTEANRYEHEELEFARAITFFDAIFAFSVTLLITSVDDFSAEAWTSLPALWKANGSSLTAFAISFLVVASFWRSSHQQLSSFRALDRPVVTLNCVVMFAIVLIPFSTEALGKNKLAGLPLPVAVYAINIIAAYVLQIAVVVVADRRGLRGTPMTRRQLRAQLTVNAVLPIVFLVSIPIAYTAGPQWAEWTWATIPVLIPVANRWGARGAGPS